MGRHLGYKPAISMGDDLPDAAVFVTDITDERHFDGAENAWEGQHEHVQVDAEFRGSAIYRARKPRLGGAWLDLISRGYSVHLNTAAETGAVVIASRKRAEG